MALIKWFQGTWKFAVINMERRMVKYISTFFLTSVLLLCCQLHAEDTASTISVDEYKYIDVNNVVGKVRSQRTVEVVPRVSGFVIELYMDEGASIEKGQLLYSLDSEKNVLLLQKEKARHKMLQAQVGELKNEFVRSSALYKKGSLSKAELDRAQSSLEVKSAEVELQQAVINGIELDIERSNIYATIGGVLQTTQVVKGDYVNAESDVLTHIVDSSSVYIDIWLSGDYYRKNRSVFKKGKYISANYKEISTEDKNLQIHYVSPAIDGNSGTIQVTLIDKKNESNLLSGQLISLGLKENKENYYFIPKEAVHYGDKEHFVYKAVLQNGKHIAKKQTVSVVNWGKDKKAIRYVIDQGLVSGDLIVTSKVKDGEAIVI